MTLLTDMRAPLFEMLCGDCRQILPSLADRKFDCAIVDPPYDETSLSWDASVDGWIEALTSVMADNSSAWVFGSFRSLAFEVAPAMKAAGWKYGQDIIWKKQNGSGFLTDRFRRVHETAVQFFRGSWSAVYKKTQFTNDATGKQVRRKTKPAHWGGVGPRHYVSHDGGPRLMTSVLEIRNMHRRGIHPTQKPVELLLPLVRYSCPPGGAIIDCFAGSGSTGLAASIEGRRSTLIELNPAMARRAERRLVAAESMLAQGITPAALPPSSP